MNSERKVAIVTGAGRGLGRAMAVGLLDHGIAVVAVDRDQAPLNELASAYGNAQLLTVAQDLTAPEAEEHVRAASLSAFGRIDILINNAGMGQSVVWRELGKAPTAGSPGPAGQSHRLHWPPRQCRR